jgi:hypothetical protein
MSTAEQSRKAYYVGRRREQYIIEKLRSWGALGANRSMMSRGPADVTCLMPTDGGEQVWCIQSAVGKYLNYAKALRLIEHSGEHSCVPIFVLGQKGKRVRWLRYAKTEWIQFSLPGEVA